MRILGELGVLVHTALLYPHKPGMAAWLNDWGVDFAVRTPGCVATGTFYPESDVDTSSRPRWAGASASSSPTCRSVPTTRATGGWTGVGHAR